MKYLLDTHVWIWWHTQPHKLSDTVHSIIADPINFEELLLSTISIWEFCKLIEKGRISISSNPLKWIENGLDMFGLRLISLSPSIAYRSTILEQPFHNDPADQIIVATGKEESAIILTKDNRILDYSHVHSLW